MAIDRLINSTQGDTIITKLNTIATNVQRSGTESEQIATNTTDITNLKANVASLMKIYVDSDGDIAINYGDE